MTTSVPGWLARQSAWQSQIAGAAGFTYGGQGIWWACYERDYKNGSTHSFIFGPRILSPMPHHTHAHTHTRTHAV